MGQAKLRQIKAKQPDWPIYFRDRLVLGDFQSNVGVATCWTPKEVVAAELGVKNFAVCGQLYTKRGINPLVRNILANPAIRHLVICGVDRQGSGEALVRLFAHGVEAVKGTGGRLESWQVFGDNETLLDKELAKDALEVLIKGVFVYNFINKPLAEVKEYVHKLPSMRPFAKPLIFPDSKKEVVAKFPSDLTVFKIKRDFIADAWLDVLKTIMRFGVDTPGMYGNVRQLNDVCVVLEKEVTKLPHIPRYLGFSAESLDKYYKGFFSLNTDKSEAYTYGERIASWGGTLDQRQLLVDKLTRYNYDRGAVIVLWEPQTDNFPPKSQQRKELGQTKGWKVPCLTTLSAQYLNDELYLNAVFRNNDMFGAWPLNAFALRRFQEELCVDLGLKIGPLVTLSHIAEIYDYDWDAASKIVEANDTLARTCVYDSRSYYIVKVEGKDIICEFFSPDGSRSLATLKTNGNKPKAARDICAQVLKELLISDLGAAADLGRQLAKAEAAVKLGLVFEQDKPLAFAH